MTTNTENCMLTDAELITTLKEILDIDHERDTAPDFSHIIRPYYAGGTLCLDHLTPSKMMAVSLLNFSDESLSNEVKYLMSKIYVQYKTVNHAHWDEANRIIKEWESDHANGLSPDQFRPY